MKNLLHDLQARNIIKEQKVFDAMLQVDRADFTPKSLYFSAPYVDSPLSIGHNATISAPHMHAYALEYLSPYCSNNIHILDVGSGSGYLTVALSKMINDSGLVVGIEHIDDLYKTSIKNISKNHKKLLDDKKIVLLNEDGRKGIKEYAPFKVIHVGAAAEEIPQELIEQLDNNGRMFIPVGKSNEDQWIYLVDKDANGTLKKTRLMCVTYVPLTDKKKQLNQD